MLSGIEYRYLLRHDLRTFISKSFNEINTGDKLLPGEYLEVIAARLDACRQGKIRRLIINLPPRCLKSHCASVAFPAWVLGHDPSTHLICVSYGQDLADKFARDCRRIITSPWYKRAFAGTRLADRQALHDFMTTAQGSRMATSVGGVLTGRGADLIIIDDPLKPDEALSEPRRKAVSEWYDHTLLSRLNDKATGGIVIIMQRLHQDDLVGHVLAQEPWEVLSLPALAEEHEVHQFDDVLGRHRFVRRVGDALHPERDSIETLAQIRSTVGEYVFASQYQQSPVSTAGIIVRTKWLRFYDPAELPERPDEIVQSWDTANKATELSDFSVCATWAVHDENYYLVDVYRERLEYRGLKRKAEELAQRQRRPHRDRG